MSIWQPIIFLVFCLLAAVVLGTRGRADLEKAYQLYRQQGFNPPSPRVVMWVTSIVLCLCTAAAIVALVTALGRKGDVEVPVVQQPAVNQQAPGRDFTVGIVLMVGSLLMALSYFLSYRWRRIDQDNPHPAPTRLLYVRFLILLVGFLLGVVLLLGEWK